MNAAGERGQGAGADGDACTWSHELRFLGNRFFHRDTVRWMAWSTAAIAVLFGLIFGLAAGPGGLVAALVFTGAGLVLMVISVLIFAAVMGNRVTVDFVVDAAGARMKVRSARVKGVNWAAVLLGAARRNPAAAGAGLAGMSQERTEIAWNELREVRQYPAERVVWMRGDVFSRLRLYCTEENYARVCAIIERHRKAAGG